MTKQEAITKERIFLIDYLYNKLLSFKNFDNEYLFKKMNKYNDIDYNNFIEGNTNKFLFCYFVNIGYNNTFWCQFNSDDSNIGLLFHPLLRELSKQELYLWYTSFTFDYDPIKQVKLVYLVHTPNYKSKYYQGDIRYEEEQCLQA
jgi:hypothetical protein